MAPYRPGRSPNAHLASSYRAVVDLVRSSPASSPLPESGVAAGGEAGNWVVNGLDRIATRIWIQRMLAIVARGIWLTLLMGCLWLLADLLGGPAFDRRIWLAAGVVLILCSLVFAVLSRPSRAQVARMLDRSFTLQERVSTALGNIGKDVPAEGEHASVVYLQIADAANALTAAQELPAFRLRPPARELVMAIALALAFAALAFARGAGGSVPPAQTNVVPAFVPAAQRFVQPEAQPTPDPQNAPSVAEVQQMVQTSMDNQQDLAALADALSDHALTHDAAEQIQQGNYSQAAEELRNVANQADQLSQSERDDLAGDLSQAASQMSEGNQSLSDATQQAADGLKQGGDPAKSGVRDLANSVEQSGQQVQSSETLDQAMQQAQQNEAANPGQGQPAEQAQSQSADQSQQQGGRRATATRKAHPPPADSHPASPVRPIRLPAQMPKRVPGRISNRPAANPARARPPKRTIPARPDSNPAKARASHPRTTERQPANRRSRRPSSKPATREVPIRARAPVANPAMKTPRVEPIRTPVAKPPRIRPAKTPPSRAFPMPRKPATTPAEPARTAAKPSSSPAPRKENRCKSAAAPERPAWDRARV